MPGAVVLVLIEVLLEPFTFFRADTETTRSRKSSANLKLRPFLFESSAATLAVTLITRRGDETPPVNGNAGTARNRITAKISVIQYDFRVKPGD
jgi:hypothetical protein